MRPHNPGLVIHHDIRNERYLLKDALPRAAAAAAPAKGPAVWKPTTHLHRQYARFFQGMTPRCTGYGSTTLCATAHPHNRPPITPDEWYERNQAFDRAQGRDYGPEGGATAVAALEVGRQLGIYSEYRWAYELRTMQQAVETHPLIAATLWYPSMFNWSDENIVPMPGPNERTEDGHFFVLNGYDARRGLWRHPTTWDTPDLWMPDELVHRLLREDGEVAAVMEVKLAA